MCCLGIMPASAEVEAAKAEVRSFLSAERNKVKLPQALVTVMVDYLVDVAEVKEKSDVTLASLKTTSKEAWLHYKESAEAVPSIHADRLDKWLAPPSSVHAELDVVTHGGGEDFGMTEDEERTLFGDVGPTTREKKQLAEDKRAKNLTGMRIASLSHALELGRVPAGEVGKYGADPRLSEIVKLARKAGMHLLSKVLDEKDLSKMSSFFSNLIRDYSEQNMVIEAQLITRWWNEAQSMCTGEVGTMGATLAKYVRAYLDKYVGRGLPVVFDMVIMMRVKDGPDGRSSEAAEALKIAKAARAEMDKARADAEKMRVELGRLKAEMAAVKNGQGGPSGAFKGACLYCGENGHKAADCPKKAADKAAKKAAAEAAGKDEE